MKKSIVILLALLFICGLNLMAGDLVLGEKIKTEKSTKISKIFEKPESFVGKTVRVEGYIVGGCYHHGRWIAVAGDKEMQRMEVWPKKDTFMFPLDHKGKYGVLEGTVYVQEMTEKQATRWMKHLAGGDHDEDIDLAKAKGGMKVYRLAPTGAVIKDAK